MSSFFFAVRYSSNLLTKRHHFGYIGGPDPNVLFSLYKTAPAFTGTNRKRQDHLTKGSIVNLRELSSDGRFESDSQRLLRKPQFIFEDTIDKDEEILFDRHYK